METDVEIIRHLLSNDADYEKDFFLSRCSPLLSKIRWKIFDNKISMDDITNDFILLLKQNDWQKLRTFSFQSTLFGWLQVVAVHHFYNNRDKFISDFVEDNNSEKKEEVLSFENASDSDVDYVLSFLQPQQSQMLFLKHINKLSIDAIANRLCLTSQECNRHIANAEKRLTHLLHNMDDYYQQTFLISQVRTLIAEDDVFAPEHRIIEKMDVQTMLKLLPNDRYRYVLNSLILKDMSRESVAQELGITTANLDNIKSRALKELSRIIKLEMQYGRF